MARRAMAPQDITRIVWVSDPQISPDGVRVAFVATTLSEERDEYVSNVWAVDTAGGSARRFTAGPKRDSAAARTASRSRSAEVGSPGAIQVAPQASAASAVRASASVT